MDYKSVVTNLCLELQQNRSWIKGLGKNPQKSELIHWRQCLLSGGTEACSLGIRETPACIHVIQRLSQPRVACWHGFQQNSQKMECVFTRCPTGGRKKIACIYGLRSEGVKFNSISMYMLMCWSEIFIACSGDLISVLFPTLPHVLVWWQHRWSSSSPSRRWSSAGRTSSSHPPGSPSPQGTGSPSTEPWGRHLHWYPAQTEWYEYRAKRDQYYKLGQIVRKKSLG